MTMILAIARNNCQQNVRQVTQDQIKRYRYSEMFIISSSHFSEKNKWLPIIFTIIKRQVTIITSLIVTENICANIRIVKKCMYFSMCVPGANMGFTQQLILLILCAQVSSQWWSSGRECLFNFHLVLPTHLINRTFNQSM